MTMNGDQNSRPWSHDLHMAALDLLIIRTETGDLTAGIPRTLNYRASVPDGGDLENILPHVQPQRSAQLW